MRLLDNIVDWTCPECGKTDQTNEAKPHTRMHVCPKVRYMSTPMVRQGQSAHIVLHEREDYVNGDLVQLDPERKRPVMSMETQYPDGHTDLRVYAPTASGSGRA